jgi:hypothetical protein
MKLPEKLKIINVGLRSFFEDLKSQAADVAHVDWRPPAGGDPELAKLLEKLERPEIDKANEQAVERMLAASPTWVGVATAKDVIPGMTENTILHSGPPIEWGRMSGPTRGGIMGALVYEGRAKTIEEAEKIAVSGEMESACIQISTRGSEKSFATARMGKKPSIG